MEENARRNVTHRVLRIAPRTSMVRNRPEETARTIAAGRNGSFAGRQNGLSDIRTIARVSGQDASAGTIKRKKSRPNREMRFVGIPALNSTVRFHRNAGMRRPIHFP